MFPRDCHGFSINVPLKPLFPYSCSMKKSNDFLPSQGSEPQPFAAVIAALLGWLTIYTYMLQAVGIGLQGAASYVCWFSYRVSSIKPPVLVMLNRQPNRQPGPHPGMVVMARRSVFCQPPSGAQPQFLPHPQDHICQNTVTRRDLGASSLASQNWKRRRAPPMFSSPLDTCEGLPDFAIVKTFVVPDMAT